MRKTKNEWFNLIKAKPESVSVKDYCKLNKIGIASYYKYLKLLDSSASNKLIPINIQEKDDLEFIEFECNGYKFKIHSTLKESELRLLVRSTR